MNVIKKAVSVIIVAVMILCLPAISFANEAGEYTVKVTVGDKTVSVDMEIIDAAGGIPIMLPFFFFCLE